ncbi:MAG TPA: hypothetical protein VN673_16540, partial [Clostridia bacterium]|nr:hypothetical protein [Clostridia bacterium]
ITRKPNSKADRMVDIEALISKGGGVAAAEQYEGAQEKDVPVIMRIPRNLLSRIDALVSARPIRTPRHTWLLEALLEKANREEAV